MRLEGVNWEFSSIGVIISATGVDPKQGDPSSARGVPDLVAVERVAFVSLCEPIALAVGELGPLMPLGSMRSQQKPPKHHASSGLT